MLGFWTRNFVLPKQALYDLSYASSSLGFSYSHKGSRVFSLIVGITGACHHTWVICWDGVLVSFCLGCSSIVSLPICLLSAGITVVSHRVWHNELWMIYFQQNPSKWQQMFLSVLLRLCNLLVKERRGQLPQGNLENLETDPQVADTSAHLLQQRNEYGLYFKSINRSPQKRPWQYRKSSRSEDWGARGTE
jgi:hypothetical protein